jgi:Cu(I)/Ag(I) efflux system membrane protein CusA/SilA
MPDILEAPFRLLWPDRITFNELVDKMDEKTKFPGSTNAWTMPIKNRIDMLSTGIRTPVGIKILGNDLATIEQIGLQLEGILRGVNGTRSVFAERAVGGYFLDFDIHREQLARYGLSIKDVQMVIMSAIGGEPVTTTIEGRERYTVNVRYPRELRDDIPSLRRVLVTTPSGANVPMTDLADIRMKTGPSMIRDESGLLAGYVFIDTADSDIGGFVQRAKNAVDQQMQLPAGNTLLWSGQFENMIRVRQRLKVVIPLTLFLIFMLLYANTKSVIKTLIVLLAVPFSLIGAVWFLYFLNYNISIGVWVGMIALMGLDAETGVFMLLYLDLAYHDAESKGKLKTSEDLTEAIVHGAVKRVRPKLMTVATALMGLLPIMWSMSLGADMMKRIAAPMIGGLVTSFILELLIYPPLYALWKEKTWKATGENA